MKSLAPQPRQPKENILQIKLIPPIINLYYLRAAKSDINASNHLAPKHLLPGILSLPLNKSGHCTRHYGTHSGLKNIKCLIPECQYKHSTKNFRSLFSRRDNMLQHYRTHLRRLESSSKPTAASLAILAAWNNPVPERTGPIPAHIARSAESASGYLLNDANCPVCNSGFECYGVVEEHLWNSHPDVSRRLKV
jgi:hypothetical protein